MDRLTLDTFLPYRLSYTTNLVSDRIARSYRQLFGLTIPEWRVIAVIAETSGISQQEIGQQTRMDKVTVSRATLSLIKRELIERTLNPADARSHRLSLSDTGAELYAQIVPKARAFEAAIFGGIDGDRLAQFERTLREIDAIVEGM